MACPCTTTWLASLLSHDEWTQIFLFLPLCDILCHLSLVHSTFYDFIVHGGARLHNIGGDDGKGFEENGGGDAGDTNVIYHSSLWSQLLARDFTNDERRQYREEAEEKAISELGSLGEGVHDNNNNVEEEEKERNSVNEEPPALRRAMSPKCDNLMIQYRAMYSELRYLEYERVPSRQHFGEEQQQQQNCEIFKVLLGVENCRLNLAVATLLVERKWKLHPAERPMSTVGIDFLLLCLKSKHADLRPHLIMQLWMLSPGPERFRTIPPAYYRGTQTLILVIDPLHSKHDPIQYDNTLRMALERLRGMETLLNLNPPRACKAVIVFAVGTWPRETPISKNQFLEQCSQAFTRLPIEYYEIVEGSETAMGDRLLRRLCALQRIAHKEDGTLQMLPTPQPRSRPGCIIS